jgi:hypothetical protein
MGGAPAISSTVYICAYYGLTQSYRDPAADDVATSFAHDEKFTKDKRVSSALALIRGL